MRSAETRSHGTENEDGARHSTFKWDRALGEAVGTRKTFIKCPGKQWLTKSKQEKSFKFEKI